MIKNVVILGGGTAGWMTAAAIAKTVGTKNISLTLVESEEIGTVGVGEATIPMISLFNNVLGIDENEFIRETNATFKLGIEFCDWRKKGHSYFHPFGLLGVDMDGISFTHYWYRWMKMGGSPDYTIFNAETQAARAAKFIRTKGETGPKLMPSINYAFQFDAGRFAKYLRRFSEKLGVTRIEGKVDHVKQCEVTGNINELVLADGNSVSGDFFIDCTGFKGMLIEGVFNAGFDDWSHWLPVNKAVAAPCEAATKAVPYTKSTALEAGWKWRIPLQNRVGNGYVYCDQYISDDEAHNRFVNSLEGELLADPKILRFTTGKRKSCWEKNCLAIGLSGGFLEPLESTSIHLIQVAIAKLLAMFPREEISDVMRARFNEEMSADYDNIKDFLIAHYHVTERDDTEFWRYVRNMQIPQTLADRLEIFKARGEALVRQTELFKEVSWFSVLVGQGMMPESYHRVADAISDDELQTRLTNIRNGVKKRIEMMPEHNAFIDQHCRAKSM
ncbi:tryptophan 7-halogenase [Gilvimarinus sp. SDUM040013]|uniref:Tryptophan halogenase family protein n=1 Tax=Gilvimarinus gilvus TaxID=3058038 RepID=A0ABU4S6K9_9GAMM|nr:tryptophan halogenase family protein [Gilvimarinus sp. SDUM040013]MDO3384414.1 tryptophan 7-halogenase [Gilvimarinus sp. SDUM040013]MDX6851019.1 tryptophan halogenase family protein [Gilvimarinus sp. SDUM040013]